MTEPVELPYEHSRRLTGSNLYFESTGAVLDVVGVDIDDALLAAWRARVERGLAHLGWAATPVSRFPGRKARAAIAARRHRTGIALALAAPIDGLFTATELNEWALGAALRERDPVRWATLEADMADAALEATPPPALPPVLDEGAALDRLRHLAALEARPRLRAMIERADSLGLGWLVDEEGVSLGEGCGHAIFPAAAPGEAQVVQWETLRNIPTALVTGSNGKTTTVRLLAACARAQGWHTAFNCTDGVFLDDRQLASGDYSGPMGARMVLRESRARAAIIEAARGGILRRGLAANRADVALVTNVSPDHLGGYGIDDLDAMAVTKLVVANVVGPAGLVVLNADDATLVRSISRVEAPLGWFALDADAPALRAHRERGGSTSGVRSGRLVATHAGASHDFGLVDTMPLTVGGLARYNIANLCGASLAALALGIAPRTIAAVFASFGRSLADNPGRLMRYEAGGAQILVDYAHNPEGLRGVLPIARALAARGRLLMLLGQAGDRGDADIEALAAIAADARPELVVIKDMEGYLRGRAPGEVPALLRRVLISRGIAGADILDRGSEIEAARTALSHARSGDAVLLLVHGHDARPHVHALIERLQSSGWRVGEALPP